MLETGMIGYVVTGIKEPGFARVGDTIANVHRSRSHSPDMENQSQLCGRACIQSRKMTFLNCAKHLLGCDFQTHHFRLKKNLQEFWAEGFVAVFSACSTLKS
jgi:hypothetical protein